MSCDNLRGFDGLLSTVFTWWSVPPPNLKKWAAGLCMRNRRLTVWQHSAGLLCIMLVVIRCKNLGSLSLKRSSNYGNKQQLTLMRRNYTRIIPNAHLIKTL